MSFQHPSIPFDISTSVNVDSVSDKDDDDCDDGNVDDDGNDDEDEDEDDEDEVVFVATFQPPINGSTRIHKSTDYQDDIISTVFIMIIICKMLPPIFLVSVLIIRMRSAVFMITIIRKMLLPCLRMQNP